MREYTEKYGVSPEDVPLRSVPVILNRQLHSGEPVDSDHNKSKVQIWLDNSDLTNPEKLYTYAIYLSMSAVSTRLDEARSMLAKRDPKLFEGREDRSFDINILNALLNSSPWGKNTTRPFRQDDHK